MEGTFLRYQGSYTNLNIILILFASELYPMWQENAWRIVIFEIKTNLSIVQPKNFSECEIASGPEQSAKLGCSSFVEKVICSFQEISTQIFSRNCPINFIQKITINTPRRSNVYMIVFQEMETTVICVTIHWIRGRIQKDIDIDKIEHGVMTEP